MMTGEEGDVFDRGYLPHGAECWLGSVKDCLEPLEALELGAVWMLVDILPAIVEDLARYRRCSIAEVTDDDITAMCQTVLLLRYQSTIPTIQRNKLVRVCPAKAIDAWRRWDEIQPPPRKPREGEWGGLGS